MTDLGSSCAIVGVGNTPCTRGTELSTLELQIEATLCALADAGLSPSDIDAVIPNEMSQVSTEDLICNLGLRDVHMAPTMHQGGASLGASIQSACMAVATGVASCVLIVAGRRGFSQQRISTLQGVTTLAHARHDEFESPYGSLVAAQQYAQSAQRHMHEYGTTSEQFGRIAVACRKHANLNPKALMHARPMALTDHQASRMITTPFRLFDCSLETDGAGALLITRAERARDLTKRPVLIAGVGEGHGFPPTSLTEKPDMTFIEGIAPAAKRAFEMAGVTPADVDVAQLHDAFTWFVVGLLEAVGFCGVGEGGPFVEGGRIELGGALPVNTHGGLLSEGHVSGINHYVEAVRQLRHEVPPARQVAGCEVALVANEGNYHEGAVVILTRG